MAAIDWSEVDEDSLRWAAREGWLDEESLPLWAALVERDASSNAPSDRAPICGFVRRLRRCLWPERAL